MTFRVDLVAGFTTMMDAYIAAHGRIVRHHRSKPAAFGDLPCSYLDLRPETITHSAGVRVRTMQPSVVVVTKLTDNGETTDLHDILCDELVDWFTGYPHIIAGTVWDEMTVADEAIGDDDQFTATRFTFGDISDGVGRD